ncbi:MAG: hypothetical protein E6Q32_06345 [Neisseriales bacterium]|nr:MAG: hypothetical protein E6Q32_06345 [Neisseriales bacterium]
MNKFRNLLLIVAIVLPISAYAGDDASLIKTRFVYEVPPTADLEKLKASLKDAIKFRAVDKTEEVNNFMPDDLPEKPGDVSFPENNSPSSNNMFGSIISNAMTTNGQMVAMSANMKGAVYGIKGYYATSVIGFSKNNSSEGYVGAIYPYEKGYRVYIYTFFNKSRDMFGKAADWVVGKALTDDLDQGYSNAVQVRDKFLEAEPEAAIKRQDPPFLSQYKLSSLNTVTKIESAPEVKMVEGQESGAK